MPKISVIIPARNEEHNLPVLLESLNKQDIKPFEIIVVDDDSSDKTASIAQEKNAKLIQSQPLPDGWLGKAWACHQGAQKAKGDILFFLDADTFFENEGFAKIAGTFFAGKGALSVNPYHRVKRPYEAFSAFFNIMQMAGMEIFSLKINPLPSGMFGPCVVVSKQDYYLAGGHESIKGKILENYNLGRMLKIKNIPIKLYGGRGCLNVRLYPGGLKQLIGGWSKSFAAGARASSKYVMLLSSFWMSGLISAVVILFASIFLLKVPNFILGVGLYVLYAWQVFIQLRRIGSFNLWTSILYPIPLFFFIGLFIAANKGYGMHRPVSWKGRSITVR